MIQATVVHSSLNHCLHATSARRLLLVRMSGSHVTHTCTWSRIWLDNHLVVSAKTLLMHLHHDKVHRKRSITSLPWEFSLMHVCLHACIHVRTLFCVLVNAEFKTESNSEGLCCWWWCYVTWRGMTWHDMNMTGSENHVTGNEKEIMWPEVVCEEELTTFPSADYFVTLYESLLFKKKFHTAPLKGYWSGDLIWSTSASNWVKFSCHLL